MNLARLDPFNSFKYLLVTLLTSLLLCSCSVLSEPRMYKDSLSDKVYTFSAEAYRSGSYDLTLNGEVILNQSWPPFVLTSRNEKSVDYKGDLIKSVLTTQKSIGNTFVQIFIFVNDKQAVEFYF